MKVHGTLDGEAFVVDLRTNVVERANMSDDEKERLAWAARGCSEFTPAMSRLNALANSFRLRLPNQVVVITGVDYGDGVEPPVFGEDKADGKIH